MNTMLDKPTGFDESCAQEVTSLVPLPQASPPSGDKLDRLDLWMWLLCFCLGLLAGQQILPVIESWFGAF